MRRRVLSLINDLQAGGAQRVAVAQLMGLDPERFHPVLASLEIAPGGATAPCDSVGVSTHRLRKRGESHAAAAWRLLGLLRRDPPAILHTHLSAAGVIGRAAAALAGSGRTRLIATLHNVSDFEHQRGSWLRRVDRSTIGACERILCVSEAVRRSFARVRPDLASRTVVVRNGVDLDHFRRSPESRRAIRDRLGYAESSLVLGAVARFESRKGLDVLLESSAIAVESAPALRILLVGDGAERGRLEARAAASDLAGRVTFVGVQQDVRPYLAAMDLFAAPSRSEGLGVAVLEALAMGLPVLGADVGGIPEIVEDGQCGRLLPSEDIAMWGEAIGGLARSPLTRARMGRHAAMRAQDFSTARSIRRLTEVYDEVCAA